MNFIKDDTLGKSAGKTVDQVSGAQVQSLLFKLDRLSPYLPFDVPLHELLSKNHFTGGETVSGGGKHVLQEASILGHLVHIDALNEKTELAIELGAGTGRLSDRLQRITGARLRHVLVDRVEFKPRQSRDGLMRARALKFSPEEGCDDPRVRRVVQDIASFDLGKHLRAQTQEDCRSRCLCMSKHLCGPAFDLAVEALDKVGQACHQYPPCAFATCCHYLCTWHSFSGRKLWLELGLSEEDFFTAVAVSQWASLKQSTKILSPTENSSGTSSWLPDLTRLAQSATAVLNSQVVSPRLPSEEFERTFPRNEKYKLGTRLKTVFDICRAARMQELGYKVKVVRYTTRSTEDRLLVASHNRMYTELFVWNNALKLL